jgi:hypothetical protein
LGDEAFKEVDECPKRFNELAPQEKEEVASILLSHTVSNPGTMMIISSHTPITIPAMLGPQRLF